jgi:hypothetical protein
VRAWRRGELTKGLRGAARDGSLQLPSKQAVARDLARRSLDVALFGTDPPPRS